MINIFHLLTPVRDLPLRDMVISVIGYVLFTFFILFELYDIYQVKQYVSFCNRLSIPQREKLEQKFREDINFLIISPNERKSVLKKCRILNIVGFVLIFLTTILFIIVLLLRNNSIARVEFYYALVDYFFCCVVTGFINKTKIKIKYKILKKALVE